MTQKNSFHYLFIAILAVAFAIRLMGLSKGIWLDEYVTIFVASQGNLIDVLRMVRHVDTHPPLYHLLLSVWSYIGNDEPFLRLLSITISMAALALMIRWMRQYANLAALLAGLFFATMPILLRYSQEIRGYGLLIFATVLTFFFATMISKQPQRIDRYIGLMFGLGLAICTQLVSILLIMPVGTFIILASKINRQQIYWGRILLATVPALLAFLFIYFFPLIYLGSFTQEWWMPLVSGQLLIDTTSSLFGFPALSWSLGLIPESADNVHAFLLIALLITVLTLSRLGDWRYGVPLLVAAILYWLSLVLYSLFRTPILVDKTVLPALILIICFASVQIATMSRSHIQYVFITGMVLLNLIFANYWVLHAAWKPVEEWQKTAQTVQKHWHPGDVVVFYPAFVEGPIRYYFSELPDESIIKINYHPSLNEVETDLNNRMAESMESDYSPMIFLVSRPDSVVRKEPKIYHQLKEMLNAKSQKSLIVYDLHEPTSLDGLREKSP